MTALPSASGPATAPSPASRPSLPRLPLLGPSARKLALTVHVAASVGWLGSVVAFVALAVAGLWSDEEATVRGSYVAMGVTAWWVILPLSLASLGTGLVQSLGTQWGLLRHWWVVVKLVINVLSTLILLVHLQPIGHLADLAARDGLAGDERVAERLQMVVASAVAVVALVVATVLSVYKPRGLTPYGVRREQQSAQ